MKCSYNNCNEKAIIRIPYGPHEYCKEHFNYSIEKRFKKNIRVNELIKTREKIGIALSGGKDSIALAYLIQKNFSKSNKLIAIIIDEGISNYREKAIKKAIELCEKIGLIYKVFSFKKLFKLTMDEIVKEKKFEKACYACGILRRNALNYSAMKLGCNKIATGHNLDDQSQTILMNLFENDFKRFIRLGVKSGIKEINGLVQRIKPFYNIPERELITFTELNKLPYLEGKCKYYKSAKRNHFRTAITEIELNLPGSMHSLLKAFEIIKSNLVIKKDFKIKKCIKCNEITTNELCRKCQLLKELK